MLSRSSGRPKGAVAFAEFIHLGQQAAQRVRADAYFGGDLFLEFAQPVGFFPVAHEDSFLAGRGNAECGMASAELICRERTQRTQRLPL